MGRKTVNFQLFTVYYINTAVIICIYGRKSDILQWLSKAVNAVKLARVFVTVGPF